MYHKVESIKELTIGTSLYIYNMYTGKYNEHVIRERLIFRNGDNSIRNCTETKQQYTDYKNWLKHIFEKELIYKLKPQENGKTTSKKHKH
jgi:hypothetical protein